MKIDISRWIGVGLAFALVAPGIAQEVKDPAPAVGVPGDSPDATGGPDAFGYTYADQASGCAYNFIDISTTGTFIFNGDDAAGTVGLSAPFDFYGTAFNALQMAANGYVTTDLADTGPDLSNDCPIPAVPSTPGGTAGARMYPLHDDLDLEAGIGNAYAEYFAQCPRPSDRCTLTAEDCTILQWDNVAHFPGGAAAPTWDFQVILYHQTNDFVYQIGPGNPEVGSGSTTGIQDFSPPTTGLSYACNVAASVPDNTAVCFAHPNPLPPACVFEPTSWVDVPTLGGAGLAALVLLLGAAAFFVLRRRTA